MTLNPPPQADSLRPSLRQSRLSEFFPGPRRHQHQPQHESNSRSLHNAAPHIPLPPPPPQHDLSPAEGTGGQISTMPPPQPIPTEASAATPHLHSPFMHFNSVALNNLPSPRSRRSSNHLASSQLSSHFGDPWPRPKHHRHIRLSYANINGFDTDVFANQSVSRLRHWLQETHTDIFLGCEAKLNWSKMPWDGQLSSWFRSGEALRTVAGHNVHEASSHERRQYGGTFGLAFGPITRRIVETGSDLTGLGRWVWFRFNSTDQNPLRLVVAYRPVRQPRSQLLSTYMQHSRYFATLRDPICPRRAFFRDLGRELHAWTAQGDRILVAGDFNEPTDQPHIVQFFTSFHMRNILFERHPHNCPISSHSRGSTVIDAIWASESIPLSAGTWLSFPLSIADHRAIVLDLDTHLLFGNSTVRILRPLGRRLNSRLPAVRQTYIRLLEQFLKRARFPHKAHLLCTADWSLRPPDAFYSHLEKMDRIRVEGMHFAEKRCRRYHAGAVFFSPTVNSAREHRDLYHLVIQRLTGRRLSRSRITKLARRCGVTDALTIALTEARRRFSQADAKYRVLKSRSADLREDFLRSKLDDPTTTPASLKAIRTLLRTEALRTTFRALHRIEGRTKGRNVDEVQEIVGTEEGDHPLLLTHSDRPSIESALQRTFRARFCLSHTTPLLTPLAVQAFGLLGWTPACHEVLAGTFDYDSLPLPPNTKLFLRGLQRSVERSPGPISTEVSRSDFISYWKRAREDTSSSYSGIHFGHYKAAAYSPLLAEAHALLTESAFRAGYPLSRWCKGLQVILEKKPGLRLVNKLRAILLMEADFNFGNKLFLGHRMIRQVTASELIPPELYGGIKGKRADLMALTRRLVLDILRQKRRSAAIASVDAESCYDRISHTAASLACQRWGVPGPILHTMLMGIQQMQFHLRTAFGDSSSSYGSDAAAPFQGICQGNGAGPAVWLAISACLVEILSATLPPNPLLAPLSTSTNLSLSGLIFVDDTDLLFVAPPSVSDYRVVISELQRRIDLWVGLLHASGGAISLDKCSWNLFAFDPSSPQARFQTTFAAPGSVTLPTPSNQAQPRPIKRLESWESAKIVGVVQAPNGSMKGQRRELHRLAQHWTRVLSNHALPRRLVWIALRTKIWAALRYPLSCTTFSKQEGHALVSSLYQRLLPRMGAARSLPNVFKYGHARTQGLGLPHPYYYQGGQQLSLLAQLILTKGFEGRALRISWEQLQLQLGTVTPFLSLPFPSWGFLATPCWLTSVWQFSSLYEIRVEGLPAVFPPLPREQDQYLMDVLVGDGRLSPSILQACNRVRMALHLLTLSDLATGSGWHLRHSYLSHRPCDLPSPIDSTFEWPPSPFSSTDLRLWNTAMDLVFPAAVLSTQLGTWRYTSHCRFWEWWFNPGSDVMYRFQPPSYWLQYHRRTGYSTRRSTYTLHSVLPADPPHGLHRATVIYSNASTVQLEGSAPFLPLPTLPPQPSAAYSSFVDYLSQLPQSTTWPLHDSLFPRNGSVIAQAIVAGNAVGVSDGSFLPQSDPSRASAAWHLVDSTQPDVDVCLGHTLVSGPESSINSYRAELQGLHAILLAVHFLCSFHRVSEGRLQLFCDNLRAVELANLPVLSLRSHFAHLDLLRAITSLRSNLPIAVTIAHVQGHQDSALVLWESLSLQAQLNIRCDAHAKAFLRDSILFRRAYPPIHLHGEGIQIFLTDSKVLTNVSEAVACHAASQDFRNYLLQKQLFTSESFSWVNWAAIEVAVSTESDAFRLWTAKFVSGFSGTAVRMHQWGLWSSPTCPCCQLLPETTAHLLTCSAQSIVLARHQGLRRLEDWFYSSNTHPLLILALLELSCPNPVCPPEVSRAPDGRLSLAFARQISLGPLQFWFGRHISMWESIQEDYYRTFSGDRRSGRSWAARLIRHVLGICHSVWVARNEIVHSSTLRGLDVMEAAELTTAVHEQFELDTSHLLPADRHLIRCRPLATILTLPADQKRIWLASIRLARELGSESHQDDHLQMASLMRNWLGR